VREDDAFAAVKTLHDEFELYNGNGIEKKL